MTTKPPVITITVREGRVVGLKSETAPALVHVRTWQPGTKTWGIQIHSFNRDNLEKIL